MSSHQHQIKKLAETLEDWDYKLDRLEHRFKGLPDELKEIATQKLEKLREVRHALYEKEKSLIDTTEHATEDIEKTIEDYIDTFSLIFEDVELDVKVEGT